MLVVGGYVISNHNNSSSKVKEDNTTLQLKPAPIWVHYMVKDIIVSVFVDLSYASTTSNNSTLVKISDKIVFAPNGGTDSKESEREEKVTSLLMNFAQVKGIDFVGIRAYEPVGYTTYYFYAKDDSNVSELEQLMDQYGKQSKISTSTDVDWTVYKEKLYPNTERQNWIFAPGQFDSEGNPVKVNLKGEPIK